MQLAGVNIKNPTVLAPLAGWTDSVFRKICKEFGVGLIFTEMASADAIVRDGEKTLDIVRFSEEERPIGIQLFGAEAATLAKAAKIISQYKPDFIDLNFGCPARKVVKRGGGSAIMRDLELIKQIGNAVVAVTDIPVTAKLRSGWRENVVLEACELLELAGVAAITVHPRTQKMQFAGQADWQLIADVKNSLSIPIIGNGDVTCADDAKRMIEQTNCDLVMIGRAARGNPWIFREVNAFLENGERIAKPTYSERIQLCIHHLYAQVDKYGPGDALFTMRKHISCYLKGLPGVSQIRQQLFRKTTIDDVNAALLSYQQYLESTAGKLQEEFI